MEFAEIISRENTSTLTNDEVTTLTISRMQDLVAADWAHPLITEATGIALEVTKGRKVKDKAQAIHWWIKRNVKFVEDGDLVWGWLVKDWGESRDKEVLISPVRLLTMQFPRGDCDDMSMLAMAMLKNVGVESAFVTVKGNPWAKDEWSHVFLAVLTENDDWIALDASHGKYLGWETPTQWEKRIWL